MIQKLKDIISCLFKNDKYNDFLILNDSSIYVDITWDDIINSFPYSEKNSSICNAFRKMGYEITCQNDFIRLEDGTLLYPDKLSEHWRLFVGSPKCKPKTIKYIKI